MPVRSRTGPVGPLADRHLATTPQSWKRKCCGRVRLNHNIVWSARRESYFLWINAGLRVFREIRAGARGSYARSAKGRLTSRFCGFTRKLPSAVMAMAR